MGVRNPVKKHMHKANCCSKIEENKRQQLLDVAQQREIENALHSEFDAAKDKFKGEEE